MTQYDQVVDRQRRLIAAERWSKQVRQIYAHDHMIEIAHYNGDVHYELTEKHPDGPKKYWVRGVMTDDELLSKFGRHVANEAIYISKEWNK